MRRRKKIAHPAGREHDQDRQQTGDHLAEVSALVFEHRQQPFKVGVRRIVYQVRVVQLAQGLGFVLRIFHLGRCAGLFNRCVKHFFPSHHPSVGCEHSNGQAWDVAF